jgi:aspartyl-tRNA synthetase
VSQPAEQDRRRRYRAYLQRCNEHRFDELGEFVAQDVAVNGSVQGLDAYAQGLKAVIDAFPDYHWDLRHLLLDGDWLSAHLIDTGTHRGTFLGLPATGRAITTQEFAVYRFDTGLIVEVWVAADNLRLLEQIR